MAASNTTDKKVNSAIRTGVIAAVVFSVGLLSGVLLAGRSFGPSPSASDAASSVKAASSGASAGNDASTRGPSPASYPGTVKQVLKDGLVVEAPKQKADEAPLSVTIRVTDKTVFWANVPKTAKELAAGGQIRLPAGSVPPGTQSVPPPASPEALKEPYKKVAVSLSDFRVNDVVTFVTADNPTSAREVVATEVGWIATLLKQAADGSPPQLSPDPGGRFGSAQPLIPPETAAPEGSVTAPAAVPPPPPAPTDSAAPKPTP